MVFSFAHQPPTPPRDKTLNQDINDILDAFDSPFDIEDEDNPARPKPLRSKPAKPVERKLFVDTPPEQSPPSSADLDSSQATAGGRRKQVNFDDAIPSPHPWSPAQSALRPLPQTRINAPLKSILKPYNPRATRRSSSFNLTESSPLSAHKFESFAEMLESVVKQLAQDLRAPRLDAYICLSNTLKALEDTPDEKSLATKMGLLAQFIQRDMTAVLSTGAPDTTLSNQALKLLIALVRKPVAVSAMSDDFCTFVLDCTIQVVEDPESSKSSINHHLGLLTLQNFSTKSMTTARAERILAVLENITDRVSGYGVQAYRLRVYRKLVRQAPKIMEARIQTWFKVVVKSMLSSQNDVRTSALEVANISGIEFVGKPEVSKAVMNYLNTAQAKGGLKVDYLISRLKEMLRKRIEAYVVPEIWGVITLFIRPALGDDIVWPQLNCWLRVLDDIMESCSDYQVNYQTTLAFNQLVFVANPDLKTKVSVSRLLSIIPRFQLERKAKAINGKSLHQVSITGLWTLLFYSFRPSASDMELAKYWNEFVHDTWIDLVGSNRFADLACKMLSYLFGYGPPKVWNERRIEKHRLITIEEIPKLDPKWIRANVTAVLNFVELCLDKASYSKSSTVEDNDLMRMWSFLMRSLAEAGSKEVKASMELKDAIARIVNMLRRLWAKHTSTPAMKSEDEEEWVSKFRFLVETSMEKLGAVHFADKFLTRNQNEDLEAAPTPSHRSRIQGAYQSPLLHMIGLLANESEGKLSDNHRLDLLTWIIEPCLTSRNTRSLKLELLMECADVVKGSTETCMAGNIWQAVAKYAKTTLEDYPLDTAERQSRHLGEEYEMVVKILVHGLRYTSSQASSVAKDLLLCLCEKVKAEAGTGAVILALVERLSDDISGRAKDETINNSLTYGAALLKQLPESISRRVVEDGRRSLWGASPMPPRTADFDPYSRLYKAIVTLLSSAYEDLDVVDIIAFKDFIGSLSASIKKCPISLLGLYLRRIQHGAVFWIQDAGRKLQSNSALVADMYRSIVSLWQTINEAFKRLPRKDSSTLSALGPLVAAGFLSRRRELTNESVGTWNCTFGSEETLIYPSEVRRALGRLTPMVELHLPGFPHDEDQDSVASFYDSDIEQSQPEVEKSTAPVRETTPTLPTITTTAPLKSPAPAPVSRDRTPLGPLPRARLRHDDSQIYFEEINSEPNDSMVQHSQIFTDRQLEVLEKQRENAAMFPEIQSSPISDLPRTSSGITRLNLTSDLPNVDSDDALHTPLKGRKSLGPMDYYIGSSPTPRNRSRTKQVMSDTATLATPDVVRSNLPSKDDPPSSPPDMEPVGESLGSYIPETASDAQGILADSFEYRQVERGDTTHDLTDEVEVHETTELDSNISYNVLERAGSVDVVVELINEETGLAVDEDEDLPSSDAESQLASQIIIDMEALEQRSVESSKKDEGPAEVHVASFIPVQLANADGEQKPEERTAGPSKDSSHIAETTDVIGVPSSDQGTPAPRDDHSLTSEDTSRVGDSFVALDSSFHTAIERPRQQPSVANLRQSARNISSSPTHLATGSVRNTPSTTAQKATKASHKRKSSTPVSANANKRSRKQSTPKPVSSLRSTPVYMTEDEDMLDCIVVDMSSPLTRGTPTGAVEKPSRVAATPTRSPAPNPKIKDCASSTKMMPPPLSATPVKRGQGRPPKVKAGSQSAEKPSRSINRSARLSAPDLLRSTSDSKLNLVDETPQPKRMKRLASQDVSRASSIAPPEVGSASSVVRRLSHVEILPTPKALKDAVNMGSVTPAVELRGGSVSSSQSPEESSREQPEPIEQPAESPLSVAVPTANASASSFLDVSMPAAVSTPVKRSAAEMSQDAPATPSQARTPLGRIMATPSSILARLKKIYADCSQLVLGSQEERAFDDVLFEIRRQVHDAGKRGRDR